MFFQIWIFQMCSHLNQQKYKVLKNPTMQSKMYYVTPLFKSIFLFFERYSTLWLCQHLFPYLLYLDIDVLISHTHTPHVHRPLLLLLRLRHWRLEACWISSLSSASHWSLLFLFSPILYLRPGLSSFPLVTDPLFLSATALKTRDDFAGVYLSGGFTWTSNRKRQMETRAD